MREDPVSIFQKVRRGDHSFIFELSDRITPTNTRYSIIGTEPWKVIHTGRSEVEASSSFVIDPLKNLEKEISRFEVIRRFQLEPKILNGAAFGTVELREGSEKVREVTDMSR